MIQEGDILAFVTVRNEIDRLPYFLSHYRKLGIAHFFMVDNGSNDGTTEYLGTQTDVSLWHTRASYKRSRFGVDWLTGLQMRYGHGHWCLTVDADEILVYQDFERRSLSDVSRSLEAAGKDSFAALMLDMYPKSHLSKATHKAGHDPFSDLCWFDSGPYRVTMQTRLRNPWVQGGVRDRLFFQGQPERAPTLNKIPFVKWNWRYTYVSSTHSALPRRLNDAYGKGRAEVETGVLLHSKFLNSIIDKSREEKMRQEHFANSKLYDAYYDGLIEDPVLWTENSVRYAGWRQLIDLGLMAGQQDTD